MSRWTLSMTLLACALGACALIRGQDEPAAPQPASGPGRSVRHISQVEFGQRAYFAECVEPGCPGRTPKTIASAADHRTPGPAQAMTAGLAPVAAANALADAPTSAASPSANAPASRRLTLLFGLGSAKLTSEHQAQLRSALPALQHTDRIVVAGRTDDLGSEALNQSLALARGLAVRDYLLDLDPQLPSRIAIDARGRCCYVAPNDGERSRSRNRRVEVAYSGDSGAAP